jgi:hypothetical protein
LPQHAVAFFPITARTRGRADNLLPVMAGRPMPEDVPAVAPTVDLMRPQAACARGRRVMRNRGRVGREFTSGPRQTGPRRRASATAGSLLGRRSGLAQKLIQRVQRGLCRSGRSQSGPGWCARLQGPRLRACPAPEQCRVGSLRGAGAGRYVRARLTRERPGVRSAPGAPDGLRNEIAGLFGRE